MLDLSIPTVDFSYQRVDLLKIARKRKARLGGRLYMGCVTDQEFMNALMNQFPNRKFWHPDANRRVKAYRAKRDITELSNLQVERQARRSFND